MPVVVCTVCGKRKPINQRANIEWSYGVDGTWRHHDYIAHQGADENYGLPGMCTVVDDTEDGQQGVKGENNAAVP